MRPALLSPEHLLEAVTMALRRLLAVALLAAVFASMGAQYRTTNFVVNAPNMEIAQQVGQWAEYYRKAKAIEWLGNEMPNWQKPCPLNVTVSMDGPSGATSFVFNPGPQGGVLDMDMQIKGPLDRLLASVLPHEITHTVFAYYFRRAVPRWADEGGSVLSEDDTERDRHDKIVRGILNRSQQFRLRSLFQLKDYPPSGDKVMCMYAEGFSVSHYIVYISNRQTFLRFVNLGMQEGWDKATQTCFGMRSVEEMEEAWLKFLRDNKGQSISQLAQNKDKGQTVATATSASGNTSIRLTVPSGDPLQPVPVYRGAMPGADSQGQTFGGMTVTPASRPGYLPEYTSAGQQPEPQPQGSWQPVLQQGAPPAPQSPIQVNLGNPQYSQPTQTVPQAVSPVGFPRQ
jgi:hypothetical protein